MVVLATMIYPPNPTLALRFDRAPSHHQKPEACDLLKPEIPKPQHPKPQKAVTNPEAVVGPIREESFM